MPTSWRPSTSAVAKLRAAGWRIEEADVTWPENTTETAFTAVNAAASALLYGERHAEDKDLFGDNVAGLIERGRTVPGTDVVAAFRFADACARAVAQFFTEYDYLLTPTTACVSWPVEQVYPKVIENREVGPRGHAAFTPLFNLALVPGISVPCGIRPRRLAGGIADRGAAAARSAAAGDGAEGGSSAWVRAASSYRRRGPSHRARRARLRRSAA